MFFKALHYEAVVLALAECIPGSRRELLSHSKDHSKLARTDSDTRSRHSSRGPSRGSGRCN